MFLYETIIKCKNKIPYLIDIFKGIPPIKTHKCDECDYECKSLWNLKIHKLSQHLSTEERSKSKYYCDICDKVFFSQTLFKEKHLNSIKHKNLFLINEINNKLNIT